MDCVEILKLLLRLMTGWTPDRRKAVFLSNRSCSLFHKDLALTSFDTIHGVR